MWAAENGAMGGIKGLLALQDLGVVASDGENGQYAARMAMESDWLEAKDLREVTLQTLLEASVSTSVSLQNESCSRHCKGRQILFLRVYPGYEGRSVK